MKSLFTLFCFILLSFTTYTGWAQNFPCPPTATISCPNNIDFEAGNFTGWVGSWGGGPGAGFDGVKADDNFSTEISKDSTPNIAFVAGRHTITDVSMGNDPYGGFPMVSPNGGGYSLKLGDDETRNGADRVQFTVNVPNDNYAIYFDYAVVVQDPSSHPANAKPRFTISIIDATTNQPYKDGCYDLNFIAGADLPGFLESTEGFDVIYKPWSQSVINLSGAAGKTLIIDVLAGDCTQSGHWGYGYFDVTSCEPFQVQTTSSEKNK